MVKINVEEIGEPNIDLIAERLLILTEKIKAIEGVQEKRKKENTGDKK